jgi:hypothetical protein
MELLNGQLHVWQLGVDLCLVTAILLFSFRWMKSDRTQALLPRTMELESSLRALIQEADGAGRHLNDQLLRREQNLQKLLADIDALDQKIQRDVEAGEQRTIELRREQEKAHVVIDQVQEILREFKAQLQGDTVPQRQREYDQREISPQRGNSSSERYRESHTGSTSAPYREPVSQRPAQHEEYHRPIRRDPAAPQSRRAETGVPSQQRTQIYRENMGHRELQQVYAAAETMLKEGRQLEQVSAQTRLPVEEIRLLSQMIEVERDEQVQKSTRGGRQSTQTSGDRRLGALGTIRRHNATL